MIKFKLDEDDCIDLLTVLRINQINQEQAWAIGYMTGALMQRLPLNQCAPIESVAQIRLHKEGFVHEKSCKRRPPGETNSTTKTTSATSTTTTPSTTTVTTTTTTTTNSTTTSPTTPPTSPSPASPTDSPNSTEATQLHPTSEPISHLEAELVASLGIALFWALDYGIPDDEERKLSITMEYLIFQSQSEMSLERLAEICIKRLPIATKTHADLHYREVCKSLVSDTIELSIFLEKIYTASMVLSDIALDVDYCLDPENEHGHHKLAGLGEPLDSLRALKINDWARLWMQVIRELRQRGKFKQALALAS